MHRTIFVLLASSAAIGLAADGPHFEVASVKPAAPLTPGPGLRIGPSGGPGTSDPGQVTYRSMPLKFLLTLAYGVKNYQITGPGWLDTERYDIIAKIPPDTNKEQFALMLQSLLADRFNLTLHRETKDLPLYELVVAKSGPKLKPYVDDPNAAPMPPPGTPLQMGKDGFPKIPPGANIMMMMNGRIRMGASKQTIARLADTLSGQLGKPVVDKTGLTGEYDFTLDFSTEGLAQPGFAPPPPPPPGAAGGPTPGPALDQDAPTLLAAVQEQLGLKLDSKKGPLDLLVIDHADKVPTEN